MADLLSQQNLHVMVHLLSPKFPVKKSIYTYLHTFIVAPYPVAYQLLQFQMQHFNYGLRQRQKLNYDYIKVE